MRQKIWFEHYPVVYCKKSKYVISTKSQTRSFESGRTEKSQITQRYLMFEISPLHSDIHRSSGRNDNKTKIQFQTVRRTMLRYIRIHMSHVRGSELIII